MQVEMIPYLLKYGNRLLTEMILPVGTPTEDARTIALLQLRAVPGVFTAGTGTAPFEFENMLRFATINVLPGTGYRLTWQRIRQILPSNFNPPWLPNSETPACQS